MLDPGEGSAQVFNFAFGGRAFLEKDLLIWKTIIIKVMVGGCYISSYFNTMEMYFSLACSPALAAGKGGGDFAPARCSGTPAIRDSTLDTWLLRSSLVPVGEEREDGELPGRDFRGRPGCDIYHSATCHWPELSCIVTEKLQRRLGNVA